VKFVKSRNTKSLNHRDLPLKGDTWKEINISLTCGVERSKGGVMRIHEIQKPRNDHGRSLR
jgi:hypothetical protein